MDNSDKKAIKTVNDICQLGLISSHLWMLKESLIGPEYEYLRRDIQKSMNWLKKYSKALEDGK